MSDSKAIGPQEANASPKPIQRFDHVGLDMEYAPEGEGEYVKWADVEGMVKGQDRELAVLKARIEGLAEKYDNYEAHFYEQASRESNFDRKFTAKIRAKDAHAVAKFLRSLLTGQQDMTSNQERDV